MVKIIVVDEDRCLGCRSCELACAMAHSSARSLVEALEAGLPLQSRLHVEPLEQDRSPANEASPLRQRGMPLQCRHCQDAPCMVVCPTDAIHRPDADGPVLLDMDRCIGCKFCMLICPFGVISQSRDGKAMLKCDLCRERTAAGEPPACVAACPTGAMKFEVLEKWLAERRREAAARVKQGRDAARQAGR